jgi:hypothetical protein
VNVPHPIRTPTRLGAEGSELGHINAGGAPLSGMSPALHSF